MSKFYNITGSTGVTVELIKPESEININSVLLTNIHDTADATVTLFLQDDPASGTTQTYKIINLVAIPATTSLFLDNSYMFSRPTAFGLYITVGGSDTVDVIVS